MLSSLLFFHEYASASEVGVDSTLGGNFENLDTSDKIALEIDITLTPTLTLYDMTISEGDGASARVTASLSHSPISNLIFTLNNGAVIRFESDYIPGDFIKSSVFSIHNSEDFYRDNSKVDLFVISKSGGGLMDIDTSDSAEVNVVDTINTAKLKLIGVTAIKGSPSLGTVQASLDRVPESKMVVNLDNGAKLIFDTDYIQNEIVTSTVFTIEADDDNSEGVVYVTNPPNTGNTFATVKSASISSGSYSGSGLNISAGVFISEKLVLEAAYESSTNLKKNSVNALDSLSLSGIASASVLQNAEYTAMQAGSRYNILFYSSSAHIYLRGGIALWTMDYESTFGVTANSVATGAVDTSADDISIATEKLSTNFPAESLSGESIYGGFGFNYFITDSMLVGFDYTIYSSVPNNLTSSGIFFGVKF